MAQFTTRVELHGASETDYEILHSAMKTEGFSRLIKSGAGVWYHLPWAEYNLESDYNRSQVLSAAKRAANSTGRPSAVLVTESQSRTWDGLNVV